MSRIEQIFSADGLLAQSLSGFTPRVEQQRMAAAVADAFAQGEGLIVEAGTGTGKTYAYLVPALLSGKRTVISTGTKTLQDQLFQRDLPRVVKALGSTARVSLLKGRSNYLCLHRLHKAQMDVRARPQWPRLADLEGWAATSDSGELASAPGGRIDEVLAARVTSTTDNCLGSRCPEFQDCFVVKARRAAAAADVVVINHALLFADHVLRQEGFSVLPGAEAVVIDEAHQLPELALRHFGQRVSTPQLSALVRDCTTESEQFGDLPALVEALQTLGEATTRLEACFAPGMGRLRFEEFRARPGVADALFLMGEALDGLLLALKPLEERSAEFGALLERCLRAVEQWSVAAGADAEADLKREREPVAADEDAAAPDVFVRWVEPVGRGGALNATPLDVSRNFAQLRGAHKGAWVFTSATLAAGEDFRHFTAPLGLGKLEKLQLLSPFRYGEQARLFLPPGLPDPNDPGYPAALARTIVPLIAASGGGAFVLCTSHRALTQLAALLREALPQLPLLAQGEADKAELLTRFATAGNAILVGTASFWEGVDVRGQALRLVIIDRLPFAAPGDPVLDAKLDAIKARGGNAFNDEQLPRAIVALRQGAGRLIRGEDDRGLLVLCDPRLKTKPYGRRVLSALPPIPQLTAEAAALDWLRGLKESA